MGWHTPILGNPLVKWAIAGAVAVGAMWILVLLRRWLEPRFSLAEDREVTVGGLIGHLIHSLSVLVFFILAVYAGGLSVHLPHAARHVLSVVLWLALVYQVGLFANQVLSFGLHLFLRWNQGGSEDASTFFVLAVLGRILIWVIMLLLVLQNLGIDITTLIAGLGVGGIAIGLALQQVAGDMFASLAIMFDKPFEVGDFIVIDTFSGTVERVGIKTTRIRSITGEELVFPNSDLVQGRIHNYKRMSERRIDFLLGVTYDTPAATLREIPALIQSIVDEQSGTRFDRAHFKDLGAASLDFEVVYYVLSPDYRTYMNIQEAINFALIERFAEASIEFAFPTQTVHLASLPESSTAAEGASPSPRGLGLGIQESGQEP